MNPNRGSQALADAVRAGDPPLRVACSLGHAETTVRVLLEHHANLNLRDSVGRTPLLIAARLIRSSVCRLTSTGFRASRLPGHWVSWGICGSRNCCCRCR